MLLKHRKKVRVPPETLCGKRIFAGTFFILSEKALIWIDKMESEELYKKYKYGRHWEKHPVTYAERFYHKKDFLLLNPV